MKNIIDELDEIVNQIDLKIIARSDRSVCAEYLITQIAGLIIQEDAQEGIKVLENATKICFDTLNKLSMEENCINDTRNLLGEERWNQMSAEYLDEQDKKKNKGSNPEGLKWIEV